MRVLAMLVSTLTLLTALQTRLLALELPEEAGKAFDAVQVTSAQNMEAALEHVFSADRSCLLFPLGDDYATERHGVRDSVDRTTEVMLQITTKDYSVDALELAGSATDPSILALKDLVLLGEPGKNNGLLGSNLGIQGVKILPAPGAIVQLEQTEGNTVMATRQGWSQILRIRAGGAMI